jgi:GTP-binding protein
MRRREVTDQDKKIAGIAHEAGKGIIVVVNKWDLIEKDTNTMNRISKGHRPGAPVYVLRALRIHFREDGQRLENVMDMVKYVSEKTRF